MTASAGLVATGVMTAAMAGFRRALPKHQRYPLPPRLITTKLLHHMGLGRKVNERQQALLALANHFAYGAAAGALYAPLTRINVSPLLGGALFGLTVWTVSYLGWLPAAGILTSAKDHPPERNALMIGAHIVWGSTLALTAQAANRD